MILHGGIFDKKKDSFGTDFTDEGIETEHQSSWVVSCNYFNELVAYDWSVDPPIAKTAQEFNVGAGPSGMQNYTPDTSWSSSQYVEECEIIIENVKNDSNDMLTNLDSNETTLNSSAVDPTFMKIFTISFSFALILLSVSLICINLYQNGAADLMLKIALVSALIGYT